MDGDFRSYTVYYFGHEIEVQRTDAVSTHETGRKDVLVIPVNLCTGRNWLAWREVTFCWRKAVLAVSTKN